MSENTGNGCAEKAEDEMKIEEEGKKEDVESKPEEAKEEDVKVEPEEAKKGNDDMEADDLEDEYDEDDEFDDDDQGPGDSKGAKDHDFKRMLFLQFPTRKMPGKEEIQALHPDIIEVEIPRFKNARFCWLEFETRDKAEKAMSDLSSVRLEGGKYLRVSWKANPNLPRRFRREPDNKKKWILIEGIPVDATMDQVRDAFFGVHRCKVGKKNHKKNLAPGSAILVFNSVKNAVDFYEDKDKHNYDGKPLKVKYLKEGPSKKALARRRRKERRVEYEQRYSGHHDRMY